MEPGLPDALAPLAFLAGTWTGRGHLTFPTITDADYVETISFASDGRPFLAYEQSTRIVEPARPAHRESGFWRLADGRVEVILAHVTGLVEVLEGSVSNEGDLWVVDLESTAITGSTTSVPVAATARRFEGDGETLRYTMAMAAAGEPLTHHLAAEFTRV